jgi:hypothetical protein
LKPFSAYWKNLYSISFKRESQKNSVISMNKKTIYIIVAVLVVVIVVAGAGIWLMYGGGGGTSPTPTPTPVPTVVGATTLQFNVNETTSGQLVTFQYAFDNLTWDGTNINMTNAVVRLDIPGGSLGNYSYIFNVAELKSWSSTDNGVTWTQDDFASDWAGWSPLFSDYLTHLVNWNGSDLTYSYTATSGSTEVIYDIRPNPTLPASLFATS